MNTTTNPVGHEATTRMFRNSMRLTHRWALRMHKRLAFIEVEELYSVGLLTLLDAIGKFDPARGGFVPYLRKRLTWAMTSAARTRQKRFNADRGLPMGVASRYLRDRARPIRVTPAHEEQRLPSLLEFRTSRRPGGVTTAGDLSEIAVHGDEDPESLLMRRQIDVALRSAIHELPTWERTILTLHYFAGERFTVIATLLNMTRARVSQLHRSGLTRCREILRRRDLDLELLISG